MKVVKDKFNDLSKELLGKIPTLKKGEQVTFIMLNGIKNPDPDPDEQKKRPMLYPKQNIPMNDYIKDLDGSWKHIVVAESWNRDEPARERFFMAGLDLGGLFNGKFTLVGGNKVDEELYEYLMVSNYNEAPLVERDVTKPALFKLVSAKAEATNTTNKVQILRKALDLASEMDEETGKEFAASLNWATYPDWAELQAKILDFARTSPDELLKVYQDPKKKVKSLVKAALDSGAITFDLSNGEVKLGDNTLVVFDKKERKGDILELMALWFNTAKNGTEILDSLKHQLTPA